MEPLIGRRVLILGGAGEVGEGIVRQFLAAGATVIAPSRTPAKLEALRTGLAAEHAERLHTPVAEVGSEAGAIALRERLVAEGGLTAVVASLGGWWQGKPLIEVDLALWERLLGNSLTAHFIAARTFLPLIADRADSSYTLINGGGALHPVPGAGPVVVAAAAQLMLGRVLAAEHQNRPVRINSLVLATPIVTRSRPNGPADWLTADDAGRYCVALAVNPERSAGGEPIIFSSRDQL